MIPEMRKRVFNLIAIVAIMFVLTYVVAPPRAGAESFPIPTTLIYTASGADSSVKADLTLSDTCFRISSWGAPTKTGNTFTAQTNVSDLHGASVECVEVIIEATNTYDLGRLAVGSDSFTLTVCLQSQGPLPFSEV